MGSIQDFIKEQGSQVPVSVPPTGGAVSTGGSIQQFLQQSGVQEFDLESGMASEFAEPEKSFVEREGFLQSVLQPAIGLGKDIAELTPDVKEARESFERTEDIKQRLIERLQSGEIDERQQRLLESITGEDQIDFETLIPPRSTKQVIGDILGTAALVVPAGHIIKGIKGAGLGVTAVRGAITGAVEAGARAAGRDEDVGIILRDTAIGGALGAPFEVGAVLVGRGIKRSAQFAAQKVKNPISKIMKNATNKFPFFSSIEARLRAKGPEGAAIANRFIAADEATQLRVGGMWDDLIDSGIMDMDGNLDARFIDAAEGRIPVDDGIRKQFKIWDKIRNEIGDEAEGLGVQVSTRGREFDFAELNRKLAAGEITKAEAKKFTLGAKGAKAVPFKKKENFFPHQTFTIDKLKTGPARQGVIDNAVRIGKFKDVVEAEKVLDGYINFIETSGRDNIWADWLVKDGQAENIAQAKVMSARFFDKSRIQKASSLEKAREIDFPFWNPNVKDSLSTYIADSVTRLEEIKQFGGQKLKTIDDLIGKLQTRLTREKGIKAGIAAQKDVRQLVNVLTGVIDEGSSASQKVSRFMRTLQIPKLAFAQIANLGQSANTLLSTDLPSFMKGFSHAFTDAGKRRALRTGSTLQSVLQEAHRATGVGTDFGEKFLRMTGFTAAERFNRVVSANVGINYAQRTFQKLAKDPKNVVFRQRLQELGINPAEVLAKGGLTEQNLLLAGQRITAATQFRSRPIDLPKFAQSPTGKLAFQFKNFAFQQAKFLKNRLQSQMKAGNYKGLARDMIILGTIFPMTGEVIADIRSLITGTKRPTDALERYFSNIAQVGGLGIISDTLESAKYGKLAEFVIGPTGSMISELGTRGHKVVTKGDLSDSDIRFLLSQTGFGRAIGNYLYPNSRRDSETFLKTLQDEF